MAAIRGGGAGLKHVEVGFFSKPTIHPLFAAVCTVVLNRLPNFVFPSRVRAATSRLPLPVVGTRFSTKSER